MPKARMHNQTSNLDHTMYHCIFMSSLYNCIEYSLKRCLNIEFNDRFYLFPYYDVNQPSYEIFIFSTNLKIAALQASIHDRFANWSHFHFYARYLSVIKLSIEICNLYNIRMSFLNELLEDAELSALGLINQFMTQSLLNRHA